MLFFNEYLSVVKFIEDKFSGFMCLLEGPGKTGGEGGLEEQTSGQIVQGTISRDLTMQPSAESRNIFWSPEHHPKLEEALSNIDIQLAPAKQ